MTFLVSDSSVKLSIQLTEDAVARLESAIDSKLDTSFKGDIINLRQFAITITNIGPLKDRIQLKVLDLDYVTTQRKLIGEAIPIAQNPGIAAILKQHKELFRAQVTDDRPRQTDSSTPATTSRDENPRVKSEPPDETSSSQQPRVPTVTQQHVQPTTPFIERQPTQPRISNHGKRPAASSPARAANPTVPKKRRQSATHDPALQLQQGLNLSQPQPAAGTAASGTNRRVAGILQRPVTPVLLSLINQRPTAAVAADSNTTPVVHAPLCSSPVFASQIPPVQQDVVPSEPLSSGKVKHAVRRDAQTRERSVIIDRSQGRAGTRPASEVPQVSQSPEPNKDADSPAGGQKTSQYLSTNASQQPELHLRSTKDRQDANTRPRSSTSASRQDRRSSQHDSEHTAFVSQIKARGARTDKGLDNSSVHFATVLQQSPASVMSSSKSPVAIPSGQYRACEQPQLSAVQMSTETSTQMLSTGPDVGHERQTRSASHGSDAEADPPGTAGPVALEMAQSRQVVGQRAHTLETLRFVSHAQRFLIAGKQALLLDRFPPPRGQEFPHPNAPVSLVEAWHRPQRAARTTEPHTSAKLSIRQSSQRRSAAPSRRPAHPRAEVSDEASVSSSHHSSSDESMLSQTNWPLSQTTRTGGPPDSDDEIESGTKVATTSKQFLAKNGRSENIVRIAQPTGQSQHMSSPSNGDLEQAVPLALPTQRGDRRMSVLQSPARGTRR